MATPTGAPFATPEPRFVFLSSSVHPFSASVIVFQPLADRYATRARAIAGMTPQQARATPIRLSAMP